MSGELCSILDSSASDRLCQSRVGQGNEFEGVFHDAKHCLGCGRVFFDAPDAGVLSRYYNSEYAQAGASSWYNVDADYAPSKVVRRADRIASMSERFGFGPTHVYHEVGCAFGGTVHELNSRGYATSGTDLAKPAISDGRLRGNMHIFAEPDIAFLAGRRTKPNVVYGYHVLEHMPDPILYLKELAKLLPPDAIVIMFVPNSMAVVPLTYGYNTYMWFYYPAHLNMYSPGSLTCLADAAGYELLDLWTHAENLDPDRVARVISGPENTPVTDLLRYRMMDTALLHEELAFVLTPKGSIVAERHRDAISQATWLSTSNKAFEVDVINTARVSPMGGTVRPVQPTSPLKAADDASLNGHQATVPALAAGDRKELLKLRTENIRLKRERDALGRAVDWYLREAQGRGADDPGQ